METKINILDLGKMEYKLTWDIQKEYHQKVLSKKEPDTLILVEHEPSSAIHLIEKSWF